MSKNLDPIQLRELVDARLMAAVAGFSTQSPALHQAMAAAVSPLGKRFRGTLMLMVAAQTGALDEILIDAACAIEILHAASLVIDDLPSMDDADMRRGHPANHVLFGEDRAILAGIAMVADATRLLTQLANADAETRVKLIEILSNATGSHGLCAGQELDLRATKSDKNIELVQDLKTGILFSASFEMIGVAQKLDPQMRADLTALGRLMGRVFQLCDDLYDALGRSDEMGKDIGKDISNSGNSGTATGMLSVVGLDEAITIFQNFKQDLRSDILRLWPNDRSIINYIETVLPDDEVFLNRLPHALRENKLFIHIGSAHIDGDDPSLGRRK